MPASLQWVSSVRLRASLALRNVLRHRQRTAFTLCAIAFGVAALIITGGFIQDIYRQLADAIIHSQSGHLQIARKDYFDLGTRNPSGFLSDEASLRGVLHPIRNDVQASMSRLSTSGIISTGPREFPVMVEAIEPAKEAALGVSLRYLEGAALQDTAQYGVSLGAGVAKALNVKVGDDVTLLVNTPGGSLNTVDLKVTGVFQSFFKEYDDRAIRAPLATIQSLMGVQQAHVLVVQLREGADAHAAVETLRSLHPGASYEVRGWYELSDFYEKTVQLYDRQFGAVRFVIFLMVMLSVINAMNMSVFERLGEVGTMRALGNSTGSVFALVVMEAVILGLLGALAGLALGVAAAKLISLAGIPMPPPPNSDLGYVARVHLDAWTCATSAITGFLATAIASLRPARLASRMPICTALRQAI